VRILDACDQTAKGTIGHYYLVTTNGMSNPTLVAVFWCGAFPGPFPMMLASRIRIIVKLTEVRPTGNRSCGWRFWGINCWRYLV